MTYLCTGRAGGGNPFVSISTALLSTRSIDRPSLVSLVSPSRPSVLLCTDDNSSRKVYKTYIICLTTNSLLFTGIVPYRRLNKFSYWFYKYFMKYKIGLKKCFP